MKAINQNSLPTKTKILKNLDNAFEALEKNIASIKQEQIDVVPFEGSWTIGQVVEHIIKSSSGLAQFFNSQVEPSKRAEDEKVEAIKTVFLDLSIKMKSPDFILPIATFHKKGSLLAELDRIKKEMTETVKTLDLSMTCLQRELPTFGYLTRMEWICFSLFHMQRHTEQIRNIVKKL